MRILLVLFVGILFGCKTLLPPERVFVPPNLPAQWADTPFKQELGNLLDTLPAYRDFFQDSTLRALINIALAQNFDLKNSLRQIRVAEADFLQAKGARFPFVSLGIGAGLRKYGDFTEEGVGNFDVGFSNNIPREKRVPYPVLPNFNFGLSTNWEVDIWHKLKDNQRARGLNIWAQKQALAFLKMWTISQVAKYYYQLISMDYAFEVLGKNIDFQQKAIEIVRVQKQSGYLSSLAIQQLQAQLLTLTTTQKQIKQNIINLENNINNLLGRRAIPILRSWENFLADTLLLDLSKTRFSTRVLLARPDIAELELRLASAEIDIIVARKAFFPRLSLDNFLGLTSFDISQWFNLPSIATNLLGSLAYPIFNKTHLKANLRRKQARAEQILYEYHKVVIGGYNEVRKNLQLLATLQENYALQKQRLALLEEAKQTATELAMANYANYLEIITAQRAYLDALLETIQVRAQIFSTQIDLYKSLGGAEFFRIDNQ